MNTKDLLVYENGNGGELLITGNDISMSERIYYKVYLALFGGNVEAVTKGNELSGQIRLDWWGNSLLFSEQPKKQFNSETEAILNNVALNSAGRIKILTAVENDLKYLKNLADLTINVVFLASDRVSIEVSIKQPQNSNNSLLKLVWDNAKNELIISQII